MENVAVEEIQKKYAGIIKRIKAGEDVMVIKSGKPMAKRAALGLKEKIDWPDFYKEAVEIVGESLSDVVVKGRADQF